MLGRGRGYDAALRWEPAPGAAGYRVFWRRAWTPDWEHELSVGPVTEVVLPGLSIDDYVFVNFVVPQLVAKEQWTEVDEARARVAALAGYQFVYITDIVKPKINIRPADRVKYLQEHRNEIAQPERWRVRYIFLRSEETDPLDLQDAVQKKMEDIRADILRGKIDFAEAARQYSQAPSAANGGEIPPFRRGELFFYFEQAAANLKPGEVSEVIHGPHGFYLVQLLEVLPAEELSMENPEQAAKV